MDGLGRLDHARDVGLADFAVLDSHHAAGVEAADVAAGNAGVDAGDFAVGHQLGLFERLLDAVHRRVDIDHHTAFEAVARCRAKTGQAQGAVGQHLGDHRHHLGGSNVQSND